MFKKGIFSTIRICIVLGLMVFVFGCSSDLGLNPEVGSGAFATAVDANSEGRRGVPETALKFIELPAMKGKNQTAGDETYVEKEVTVEDGGKLHLNYTVPGKEEGHVNSFLDIAPNSIPSDIVASLSLPQNNVMAEVDLIFGPDGTVFSTPAEFKIAVADLDLSDIEDPESIGFFFYNDDTGLWERLEANIEVNLETGSIRALAWIDHFSRYAVAISR